MIRLMMPRSTDYVAAVSDMYNVDVEYNQCYNTVAACAIAIYGNNRAAGAFDPGLHREVLQMQVSGIAHSNYRTITIKHEGLTDFARRVGNSGAQNPMVGSGAIKPIVFSPPPTQQIVWGRHTSGHNGQKGILAVGGACNVSDPQRIGPRIGD